MQANYQLRYKTGLYTALTLIISTFIGLNYYFAQQDNDSSSNNTQLEVSHTNLPAQQPTENKTEKVIVIADSNILSLEYISSKDESSQNNHDSEKTQQAQKATRYQQLISSFNQVDGNDKIILLHEIWRLAPEVGIDENLLTLLQLAAYDPNARIEKLSRQILSDLQRVKNGLKRPEEELVSQILALSVANDISLTDEHTNVSNGEAISSEDLSRQRNNKIEQLAQLALTSGNIDTREYALNNLQQFDPDLTLDIIRQQLLNSNDSNQRFLAIERLRSVIGNIDSNKIRQILLSVNNDYDELISESASATLKMLDDYTQIQDDI